MFFWNVEPAPVRAPVPHGMLPAWTPLLPLPLPELLSLPQAVRPSRPPPSTRMAAGAPHRRRFRPDADVDTHCPFVIPAEKHRVGDFLSPPTLGTGAIQPSAFR